jgi:hypothetical protein
MRPYPRPIHAETFGDDASEDVDALPGESLQIGVLYHSIELTPMTWQEIYLATTGRPDGASPGAVDPAYPNWLKYRLNELGYLAGPLVNAKDAQALRALHRYSRVLLGREEDDETRDGIVDAIADGRHARTDLVETPGALADRNRVTRLVLDHDYYVVEPTPSDQPPRGPGEANLPDGHATMETQKLDRFEQPFKVKVYLVSKRDRSGTGKGVFAPEATGAVKIEWHVFDPPEDMTVIDARFTSVDGSVRTRAPEYLTAAQTALAGGDPKHALNAYDNCPVALGGVRPDDNDDMTPYFRAGGLPGVYADEIAGKKFLSTVRTVGGTATLDALRGTTGAIFWGSYIAGDNWVVQARLSFAGIAGEDELIAAHRRLPRHAKAFTAYEPGEALVAQSAKMTLWRRHRVLGVVDWWSNPGGAALDWPTIVAAYRAAHTILIPPGRPRPITEISDAGQQQRYATEFVRVAKLVMPAYLREPGREEAVQWQNQAIIPTRFPVRDQAKGEDVNAYKMLLNGAQLIAHYCGATYALHRLPADFVRARLGNGVGQVILRFDHLVPATLRDHLNATDKKKLERGRIEDMTVYNYKTDARGNGGPSIGVSGGVAMIEHQQSKHFGAGFLVAHEMGHNHYLTHAYPPNDDHDRADGNCTMFYPSQVPQGFQDARWGLAAGGGAPLFCGKCLLKLRGWKVRPPPMPTTS